MATSHERSLQGVGVAAELRASEGPAPQGQAGQLPVHIRWMIRRDMPEVLAIEEQCFEFPWQEDDFIRCLRQRNCIGMVAEASERVVGFMIYELHKSRLHVLNFAVHEAQRRRGVGRQMSKKLISKLSHERRSRILLEIRETNLPGQLFFRQLGFRAVSVLRDFYEDTTEDAYLMQYRHTAAAAAQAAEQEGPRRMAG
jgi:ribosomal-protein-alanine N-acetyltransferase